MNNTSKTQQFIEKAKLKHDYLYDYSKVDYTNTTTKVTIMCRNHGEFSQAPANHLNGNGCPKCNGTVKSNTNAFIEKAQLKHGNLYDYKKVDYKGNKKKVTIICKQHGDFEQTASDHLSGKGCLKCGIARRADIRRSNTDNFIENAKHIHGDLYDYNKIYYEANHTKVTIVCEKHGEFTQTPASHLQGHGCPKCALEILVSKSETEFLDWLEVPNDNRQYPIGKYFVDGVVNNTIYEFLGDYWHGHGRLEKGLNYIDIQIKRWLTAHRFSEIQKLTGFNIKYVWESDWNEFVKIGGRCKLRTFDGKMQW